MSLRLGLGAEGEDSIAEPLAARAEVVDGVALVELVAVVQPVDELADRPAAVVEAEILDRTGPAASPKAYMGL